jgi:hypothetical protein
MSEGIVWLSRLGQLVLGLAFLGGAFALWGRSKGAALCGAGAGALLIFFEILQVVLNAVLGSGATSPVTMRMIFSLTFGFGTILHYALVIAMVVLVSRKAAT